MHNEKLFTNNGRVASEQTKKYKKNKHLQLVFVFGRDNNWPTICGSPQVTIAAAIAATMAGPIAICVPMNYLLNWLAND